MRIAFLCSSLEAGRDGVGDFVTLLSEETRRQGNSSSIIALQDQYIATACEGCVPDSLVPTVRLPSKMSWPERTSRAGACLSRFDAHWISLHFVSYGFNRKGINWNLGTILRTMAGDRPVHLMLHELWIGANRDASLKERVIGAIQRWCILRMIREIRPAIVTTSNPIYVALLKDAGVSAEITPLSGNILRVEHPDFAWLDDELRRIGLRLEESAKGSLWIVAFFGTLHPEWEAEPLFSILRNAATAAGRRVCMVTVGRLGANGEQKWSAMKERYSSPFCFINLGEQPPDRISEVFQAADFGIATSPWQLIGKSGSAIAMLEHGLPVVANRDNWHARGVEVGTDPSERLLYRCDDLLEKRLVAGLPKRKPINGVRTSAERFVQTLRETVH